MSIDPKSTYYDIGGISVMDVIKAKVIYPGFTGFLHGNAIKYVLRLAFKGDPVRDIEKAVVYLNMLKGELIAGMEPIEDKHHI